MYLSMLQSPVILTLIQLHGLLTEPQESPQELGGLLVLPISVVHSMFRAVLLELPIRKHGLHTNTDLDVGKALALFNTTSPSYPLLAVIESTIKYLNSKKGRAKIDTLITEIEEFKKKCTNVEFYNGDTTKILIKKSGMTGFELSEFLYKNKIEDERANNKSVLLLTGLGTDYKKLDYLFKKLKNV